jgi:hypothetical protein
MRRIILLLAVAAMLAVAMTGFQAPAWAQGPTLCELLEEGKQHLLQKQAVLLDRLHENREQQDRLREKLDRLRHHRDAAEEREEIHKELKLKMTEAEHLHANLKLLSEHIKQITAQEQWLCR